MAEKATEKAATSGRVQKRSGKQALIDQLELEASMNANDGDSVADVIIERMMAAETIEEVFAAQDVSLPSGKSLVDMEMEILDYTVRKGDPQFEEHSLGYYYVIDAINLDTGAEVKFATGAPNVVILLNNLRGRGALPCKVALRGKATANGTLLMMRHIGPRTVSQ